MLAFLYNKIPKSIRDKVGKTKALKKFRDLLLRKDGVYKESIVKINKKYTDYNVNFKFAASIKDASKAYTKGIENTMLSNSIKLLRKRNTDLNGIMIFDIGANFGYLSLVWAKSVCESGRVIAFEPSANVYNTLSKSVRINHLNDIIQVENLAVGNENKSIQLYLENSTSNIVKTDDSQLSQTVQLIRLDDYVAQNKLERCDLIKIDVDGIEMDILKGSINVLNKFKPIFIVETNDDVQIAEFFIHNNYQILNEKLEVYKLNDTLPLNIYCVPNP